MKQGLFFEVLFKAVLKHAGEYFLFCVMHVAVDCIALNC